jgi:hypothetical protein
MSDAGRIDRAQSQETQSSILVQDHHECAARYGSTECAVPAIHRPWRKNDRDSSASSFSSLARIHTYKKRVSHPRSLMQPLTSTRMGELGSQCPPARRLRTRRESGFSKRISRPRLMKTDGRPTMPGRHSRSRARQGGSSLVSRGEYSQHQGSASADVGNWINCEPSYHNNK